MVTIVQKEDPVLRKKAALVPDTMFGTPKLKKILKDMSKALALQDDGVALAAPQIGLSLRIFIVSGKIFELMYPDAEGVNGNQTGTVSDLVFINPTIIKLSAQKEIMEEGCLSVRYLYGNTKRSKKARVRAYDVDGKVFELGGSGLLAQIFQHETDHLEGILFTDTATNVHDMPPATETVQ